MELKVESGGIQEDGNLGWGRSLPVPSIQEIVRNDSNSVPDRYIQEHKDRPQVSENLHASLDIPVLDFSLLAKGDENERRKLHLACKEWGFFQVNLGQRTPCVAWSFALVKQRFQCYFYR